MKNQTNKCKVINKILIWKKLIVKILKTKENLLTNLMTLMDLKMMKTNSKKKTLKNISNQVDKELL